jgi:hypothetical protein
MLSLCNYLECDVLQFYLFERGTDVLLRKPSFVWDDVMNVLGEYLMRRLPVNKICDEQRSTRVQIRDEGLCHLLDGGEMVIRRCTLCETGWVNHPCAVSATLSGTHNDHVKGHVFQPLQPPLVWGNVDGSHFFGRDTVIADDLVILIDHSLADIDADDRYGILCRQYAGDETCRTNDRCGVRIAFEYGFRLEHRLTCSTRKIHHGRDALLEQPGVPHGLSDFLGASLCIATIVVLVCYCVKVVLVRCFVVVRVSAVGWWVRMWPGGVRVMMVVRVCVGMWRLRHAQYQYE